MPAHQDAYISDVVVVVDTCEGRTFDDVLNQVKQCGLDVRDIDPDNCTIEGSVDAGKVKTIDDLPGVEYVRSVFTYVADYPPDDPRDQDKVAREYGESE